MMDCVLISIKPEWVCEILNGNKLIEIRKNFPNLKPPFKVYIYCTKGKQLNYLKHGSLKNAFWLDNKAYGQNICVLNGKIVGEFICTDIEAYDEADLFKGMDEISNSWVEDNSCVDIDSLLSYKGKKDLIYGWYINGVNFYKEQLNISDFKQTKVIRGYHRKPLDTTKTIDINYLLSTSRVEVKKLTKAPQSWCYVDEVRI